MHSKLHFLVKSLICLKSGDQYVSQFIEVDGGWEIPIVTKVMEAMDHYPNAVALKKNAKIFVPNGGRYQ